MNQSISERIQQDGRIRVITGGYGAGKTEFAVNYAFQLAALGYPTALVDLDVINLYFRSREKKKELEEAGIRVIASSLQGIGADLPAISAEVAAPLQDPTWQVVMDVGGDAMGARALARYREYLKPGMYEMLFIVNGNRPETDTLDRTLPRMEAIEMVSGVQITALVNNTHLVRQTTVRDIIKGQRLCRQIAKETGLPIRYVSVIDQLATNLPDAVEGSILPLGLLMRETWMS